MNYKFSIENISSSSQKYTFKTFIEKPYIQSLSQFVRMSYLKAGSEVFDCPEAIAPKIADDNPDFIRYTHEVDVEARTRRDFEVHYTMVKFARDETSWRQHLCCDKFRITINVPAELALFGMPIHFRSDLKLRESPAGVYELEIDEPLLPLHGVALWWSPRSLSGGEQLDPRPLLAQPVSPHSATNVQEDG